MFVGFATFNFAQEINQAKFDMTSANLVKSLEAGEVTFFFSKSIDGAGVKNNIQYYTNYFSVNFDPMSGKTVLKLTKDDMAKMVISRFLMSCGINEVIVEGKTMTVQDFMAEYLR